MRLLLGMTAVMCLWAGVPVSAQEAPPPEGCPAGTYLDTGPANELRPPAGFCRCPDGEVLGFVATDGSGFHPQAAGDGLCAVAESEVVPSVVPAAEAAEVVALPATPAGGGRVLPRTG